MLNEKIHVKILIIILACLTYKILFKNIENYENECPDKCKSPDPKDPGNQDKLVSKVGNKVTGRCEKQTGMCVCEDGWYDTDCQVKRQNWFSNQKSTIEQSCTGEGDQKQCKFICKDFVEKKDEDGNFERDSSGNIVTVLKEVPCLQSFYKRKEGKMPDFWNNKKIPLLNLPKESFFSVKRQSKWLINDFGVATKYELKFDEEGLPILGEDGQYQTKVRKDDDETIIREDYVGNWTTVDIKRDDDGNETSRKDVEYTQIPRIFKLKKKEWDDACSRGSIPSIWCAEKKKILVEDPNDSKYYLDTGKIKVSRIIENNTEGKISNGIEIGSEKDFNVLKKGLGGIEIEENDLQNAKKYAFAKLCLSKGYLYYEDPITKQPKCEFNKEQCLKFSKNFSDAKPDDSTGLPEKYKYAEWRENAGCIQVNEANKLFCEGDHLCSTGTDEIDGKIEGRFKYDSDTGECTLTERYCNQFSLTYDPERGNGKNGSCVTREGQRFAETLGGQSLARSGNDCPDKTPFYNTYRTNNLMEQWPNDTMQKITESCQPVPTKLKDKNGKKMRYVCKDGDNPASLQCKLEGQEINDYENMKVPTVRRKKDSVKPWYMDDSVWPWSKTYATDEDNKSNEKALYAAGKLNCYEDSECEKEDETSQVAKAVGGREGGKICLMYRCMDKRTHTQSCDRDKHCQEGLVCNGLDGCGYEHNTRENGETCNHWPECKSRECKDNGRNRGVKVCKPSNYNSKAISAELKEKNKIRD